jgi:hypothetical protein
VRHLRLICALHRLAPPQSKTIYTPEPHSLADLFHLEAWLRIPIAQAQVPILLIWQFILQIQARSA